MGRILAGQPACGYRAGGGGAHGGEVTVVQQQRIEQAGARIEQHHHAVEAGQAELGVVEEARADLDGEARQAGQVGSLHVHLAVMFGHVQAQDRRHRHRRRGQQAEGLLDGVEAFPVDRHAGAQVGFAEQGDVSHGRIPRR
ncbi:hypothetical protein D3C76_1254520 [compost metagenome]